MNLPFLFPSPPASFKGKAKRLDAWDFGRIGKRIGVGEDEIRAVAEVEASGSGFDAQGRPKMLFEPHRFYRELGERKRELAVTQGLAYPKWGERPYPADSYPRLARAIQIDRPAALRSASWGLGQILGSNHKAAGYPTVEAFVAAMLDDEEKHLEAMIAFIIHEGLDDDIRRHDWKGFARVYNGPKYYVHRYDKRLAEAFAKWSKRPDAVAP